MDRFDTITAFIAVVDHKGFAPAARSLGVSASLVTRLVAALEERLGVRLLQRTTRSVGLTDAGARFLERARRIVADLEEAERVAENEHSAPRGRLSLSAPLMFGRMHIGPLIGRYMSAHPQLSVELSLSDRFVDLVEEGFDLALRIGHLSDSALVARRMGATRRVVVGSPAYLGTRRAPKTPADLERHRLISCTSLTPAGRWRFWSDGERFDVDTAPAYATNSAEAAIWHAENNGGLTIAAGYQIIELVRAGRLAVVLADYEPAPLPIHFVYPSARLLSAKVRSLIDLAARECDWTFVDF
jgi:DNA-binding transcriptional LysR family regulator